MAKESDFKKEDEEWTYRRNLLEALLVSSVSEDSFRLPTIKEFILSEVVNGTIEYIGGNDGQIDYQKFRFDINFERELCKYFELEMNAHSKGKLNPRVRKSINKLCAYYWIDPDGPDKPYPYTGLYILFKGFAGGGICPIIMESSFSLPQETVIRVQKEVLPSLSNPEKRDVEGIGKSMRKYIDRDLEFIGQTYHW